MTKAIGYIRVSTEEQGASGLGLEAQRAAIGKAAQDMGAKLAFVHEDVGVSGARDVEDREGLTVALGQLERGDVLLVAKRDRIGRDVFVMAMVERLVARAGARLVSAAGEGTGDDADGSVLMRRILDAFSEYERLVIRSRTRAALAAKKRRGERIGAPRFGERVCEDGTREAVPEEAAVAAEVMEMAERGMSHRAIARELNARGLKTKRGREWTNVQVAAVLQAAAGAAA